MTTIAAKVSSYEQHRKTLAGVKDRARVIQEEIDRLELEIISDMADMADGANLTLGNLKLDINGRNYSVSVKEYFAIRAADRIEGYAALRAAGLGDLITERVDDRTLSNTLRVEIEQNGGAMPERFCDIPLSTYAKTTLSSRATGRKGAKQ